MEAGAARYDKSTIWPSIMRRFDSQWYGIPYFQVSPELSLSAFKFHVVVRTNAVLNSLLGIPSVYSAGKTQSVAKKML